jgi:malonyl-CoA O-methyltransferase
MTHTSERQHKIIEQFESRLNHYHKFAHIQKKVAIILADLLPDLSMHPSPRILEIGCGTGFLTELILEKYPHAHFDITDISLKMAEFCQNHYRGENRSFFSMDAENPNLTEKYDLIVSSMSVQWFENQYHSILNLSRYGSFYYSMPGENCFKEWQDAVHSVTENDGIIKPDPRMDFIHEVTIQEKHQSASQFLSNLKETGVATPKAAYAQMSPSQLKQAMRYFDDHHQGNVNWHIVFGKMFERN